MASAFLVRRFGAILLVAYKVISLGDKQEASILKMTRTTDIPTGISDPLRAQAQLSQCSCQPVGVSTGWRFDRRADGT